MRLWSWALTGVLLLCGVGSASADSSVIVLGLRSVEGDDEVALGLSRALRDAGGAVQGWSMRMQAVTLAQMSLAHGCDDVDAHCLADIAKALNTDLIVYGTLRRSSARDDYQFSARLELFNASTGGIEHSATTTFAQNLDDAESLRPVAEQLLSQLSPQRRVPELVIETNVPGAEVRVNGELMGQVQGDTFYLRDLEAGRYIVQVSAVGYETFESELELPPGKPASVSAILSSTAAAEPLEAGGSTDSEDWSVDAASPEAGPPMWLPVSLFALSGVALGATIWSWVEIAGIEGDATYAEYSNALYARAEKLGQSPSTYNICALAENGERVEGSFTEQQLSDIDGLCGKADTLEVLQYVFLGVAVVSAGTGVALLLMRKGKSDSSTASLGDRLAVQPRLGQQQLGFSASLRF